MTARSDPSEQTSVDAHTADQTALEQTALEQTTIGQLVTANPARARLFESLGLDYCCGGKKPLAQACAEKQLDAATVVRLVHAFDAQVDARPGDESWADATLSALADHIERRHHAYLKAELPRLEYLVRRVAERHGARDPHLIAVRDTFLPLKMELEAHMSAEEDVVFPACRALERDAPLSPALEGNLGQMVHEHEFAGEALSRIRDLTAGFTPPAGACNTYRVMYAALAELAEDMHRHVHKENSILFPKAIELERKRKAQVA